MKILLLSAYDAHSHRYWRTLLERGLSDYRWTTLVLPPRYFNWRIRGNALTWALQHHDTLRAGYDVILATSMVDLSTLFGLVPSLATTPSILYCHENQFAYPVSEAQSQRVEPQMVTLYAALAAQSVVFNSDYNRSSFLAGLSQLLKKLPDAVPSGIIETLSGKAQVLPVPIDVSAKPETSKGSDTFQMVWNHRWEYDKGPQQLLAALQCLPESLPLRCHVVGQQFREKPAEFREIKTLLQTRGWLSDWGYIASSEQYFERLGKSHAVLSTSLHDFQGLSVLEAVAQGCLPIVPDRLAYKELFPEIFRYQGFSDVGAVTGSQHNLQQEGRSCAAAIASWVHAWQQKALPAAPSIQPLQWPSLEASYRRLIENTSAVGKSHPSTVTIPGFSL